MMMQLSALTPFFSILTWIITLAVRLLSLLVIVQVILTYFMSPYHPVRQFIDRIVEPLLAPIRRFLPVIGMIDFSPLVLLILIQVIGQILIYILGYISFRLG